MDETVTALRVSQLDSATLDQEVENIVEVQLKRFLESIPGYDFSWLEPELNALLKSLFWYFVFRNEGATVGQSMMDMSYRRSSSVLDNRGKWAYFIIVIVLPWIRERLHVLVGWKNEDRKSRMEKIVDHFSSAFEIANLLHFLWFLNRGGFRTVWERLMGFRAVHNTQPFLEEIDVEMTERELLWHGFSDVLIFFVPLINYRRFYNAVARLGRKLRRNWSKTSSDAIAESNRGKAIRKIDIFGPCSYCGQTPPILPCHLGCYHIYCYYCLAANLEADSNFACSICAFPKSDSAVIFINGPEIRE